MSPCPSRSNRPENGRARCSFRIGAMLAWMNPMARSSQVWSKDQNVPIEALQVVPRSLSAVEQQVQDGQIRDIRPVELRILGITVGLVAQADVCRPERVLVGVGSCARAGQIFPRPPPCWGRDHAARSRPAPPPPPRPPARRGGGALPPSSPPPRQNFGGGGGGLRGHERGGPPPLFPNSGG